MSKKKFGLFLVALSLCLFIKVPVLAQEDLGVNSEFERVQNTDFENIINEIQNIKSANPEYSEDMILEIMNRNHPNFTTSGMERGIVDIWNVLTDSEKRLCIRYPFDALKVNEAKNIATSQTEIKFGYNGLGDRSDAFRHGIWNAEMTIMIGKEKAELFATAHEDKDVTGNESDGYSKSAHKEMDLHNNEIGRNIGQNNLNASEDEMANIIYETIYSENSPFIWLHD